MTFPYKDTFLGFSGFSAFESKLKSCSISQCSTDSFYKGPSVPASLPAPFQNPSDVHVYIKCTNQGFLIVGLKELPERDK